MFMKKRCITAEMNDAMKLNANFKNKPLNWFTSTSSKFIELSQIKKKKKNSAQNWQKS